MELLPQRAFQSHPQAELRCVGDVVREKADARARLLGVKASYSVEEMLAAEELETVDVSTSDTLHFEPCFQALSAGKHVLVEDLVAERAPQPSGRDGLGSLELMYACIRSFEGDTVLEAPGEYSLIS